MNDSTTNSCGVLQRLFYASACLTALAAPSQWSFEIRSGLFIAFADITLILTAALWLVELSIRQKRESLLKRLPPWSNILFVGCAALSMLVAADKLSALKELIQYILYFIVGYAVYDRFMRDFPQAVRTLLWILLISFVCISSLALFQYINTDNSDLMVRGTFGNRNVLAGYFALALPLLFSCIIETRSWITKIFLAVLLSAGLCLNLSGASYIAVVTAIALIAARKGIKWFIPVTILLAVLQSQVLQRLPRENDLVHFRSIALYDSDGNINRRYPEWQAAGSMILTNPLLGVGAGNYQDHVGRYYDNMPRRTGPAEPDTQNLHLVIGASMGILALSAFLAMFIAPFVKNNIFPMKHSNLIHGSIGSLSAFAFTAVWHPLLVRGIGLPFVMLLVLTRYLVHAESIDGNSSGR
ncbi:MAG: O-antigen ligase family protein [Kiritimatiellia bacterium]